MPMLHNFLEPNPPTQKNSLGTHRSPRCVTLTKISWIRLPT
uniref:Uncharacterized protein n=1 Tax=Arundo donax TaxID=35708 RepID=A0A0A9AAH9_ARUDO